MSFLVFSPSHVCFVLLCFSLLMSHVIFSVMHLFVEEHLTGTTDVTYWKVKPLVHDSFRCYGMLWA